MNVIVKPKEAVLDPQGNAVRDAMRHLGMPEVKSVRIGKFMEIDVDGENADFEKRLHDLCRDLLSNPVIEEYELRRSEVGGPAFANQPSRKATASREATARQAGVGGRRSEVPPLPTSLRVKLRRVKRLRRGKQESEVGGQKKTPNVRRPTSNAQLRRAKTRKKR